MKKNVANIALSLVLPAVASAAPPSSTADPGQGTTGQGVHAFSLNRIDGRPQPLSDFKGKVVLIVNTASKCGLTPQYAGLQRLYESYRERGFEILAFPANNFLWQEPGTNEQIAAFCDSRFHVTFPLFEKLSVKGKDQAPLYRYLTKESPVAGAVKWNFQKYLIDREGRPVYAFHPKVTPEDPRLTAALEELLNGTSTVVPQRIGF